MKRTRSHRKKQERAFSSSSSSSSSSVASHLAPSAMALNNGFRSAARLLKSKSVSRGFHSTGVKRMGGGHGHGHDEPEYLHAKHMYNLDKMKNRPLKMSLAVFSAFSIGVAVPVYAVIFQQKKTASG